jgi:hypothetical protein
MMRAATLGKRILYGTVPVYGHDPKYLLLIPTVQVTSVAEPEPQGAASFGRSGM